MKYNFYVSDAKLVDVNRVIAENPDETALLLVGKNAMLLVNVDKLGINEEDYFALGGETMHQIWGYTWLRVCQEDDGVLFLANYNYIKLPDGWRCRAIAKSEISKAKETMRKMREYRRKLEVRVSSL